MLKPKLKATLSIGSSWVLLGKRAAIRVYPGKKKYKGKTENYAYSFKRGKSDYPYKRKRKNVYQEELVFYPNSHGIFP